MAMKDSVVLEDIIEVMDSLEDIMEGMVSQEIMKVVASLDTKEAILRLSSEFKDANGSRRLSEPNTKLQELFLILTFCFDNL